MLIWAAFFVVRRKKAKKRHFIKLHDLDSITADFEALLASSVGEKT
jgi:hypothetical protein